MQVAIAGQVLPGWASVVDPRRSSAARQRTIPWRPYRLMLRPFPSTHEVVVGELLLELARLTLTVTVAVDHASGHRAAARHCTAQGRDRQDCLHPKDDVVVPEDLVGIDALDRIQLIWSDLLSRGNDERSGAGCRGPLFSFLPFSGDLRLARRV